MEKNVMNKQIERLLNKLLDKEDLRLLKAVVESRGELDFLKEEPNV